MRFEEAYTGWTEKRLTQEEAACLLGVCARSFRRYINRYEDNGLEGLQDHRLQAVSHLRAPVDEVLALEALYREQYDGWNVKHFHSHYRAKHQGKRSYTWVKTQLQKADLIKPGKRKGTYRKRRVRAPLAGMLIHQDGSTHQWIDGVYWDLIITLDDATSEIYSAFFVEEEGTLSSFRGVHETLEKRGLFSSFYTDRGSHYWHTTEAGGKVDKDRPTQFGRAMKQLGIMMIPSYSPQARGRSERMFKTWQGRLPQELKQQGITDIEQANAFLRKDFIARFNAEFQVPAAEEGNAFVSLLDTQIQDILCIQEERVVRKDGCVSYQNTLLQLPAERRSGYYIKTKVRVHHYPDNSLAIFHGPRKLASYTPEGLLKEPAKKDEHDHLPFAHNEQNDKEVAAA
jgi:transposase